MKRNVFWIILFVSLASLGCALPLWVLGVDDAQDVDPTTPPPIFTSSPSPPPTMTALSAMPTSAAMLEGDAVDAVMDQAAMPSGAPGTGGAPQATPAPLGTPPPTPDTMFFEEYGVNPFLDTEDDNLSTFAMDVDTASYTLARSYLRDSQQLPAPEAVRPEEFINYFDVGYAPPQGDDAFAIHLDAAPAPFGYEGHYLMRVGIQGRYIAPEDRDPALLIFVIDVSGSMDRGDRLELVKKALALLVDELRPDDRVGIVVYASSPYVVLDPTPASNADTIMRAIDALGPGGSTALAGGLQLGYQMAQQHKQAGENTRVIVLSDGVGNVGPTGPDQILAMVSGAVDDGITLSTIGFGMGNYNDVMMEQLANDGNGNYYYVDNLREARRVFVYNMTGTLQVIAYDAKIQVEFNPDVADRYRLIGYENRAIADDQFRDDTVDAGEIGAGHSITALYELALEGDDVQGVVATAYIRYRDARTDEVVEVSQDIAVDQLLPSLDAAPASFRLHAAVAEFSELLRESYWAQDGSYMDVLVLAEPLVDEMGGSADVAEFVELIRLAGRYVDR
jgi:Ca-activated chloride channel homolog